MENTGIQQNVLNINSTNETCVNCETKCHSAKLQIAVNVFNYFYKELKLLQLNAGKETERVTGIDSDIIQEAMNFIYTQECTDEGNF